MAKTKRNYKDSVFVDLFGKCRFAKENFLSLYNAIHGTNFTMANTTIKSITLKQTIYTGIYNDISMLINDRLIILVEQQSTINENMPLRFLGYISKIYDKLVKSDDRYKRKLIKLPKPEFYVIYNGQDSYPAQKTLYFSDAFKDEQEYNKTNLEDKNLTSLENKITSSEKDFDYNKITLEILVKVFNINMKESNRELLKCIPLAGYSAFVDLVNKGKKDGLKDPIGTAIKKCIDAGILSDYLAENSTEIMNMTFGEYDYKTDIRVQRQEAKEEGIEQGALERAISNARKMLEVGKLSLEEIVMYTELPFEKVKELADEVLVGAKK